MRALEENLGNRERTLLVKRGTHDPKAYPLYRRGRYLWSTRTKEGNEQAIECYRRALERDSTHADVYAGLADAYLTMFQLYPSSAPEAEMYSRAKWAGERALALGDRSSDAHTSFAIALWLQPSRPLPAPRRSGRSRDPGAAGGARGEARGAARRFRREPLPTREAGVPT